MSLVWQSRRPFALSSHSKRPCASNEITRRLHALRPLYCTARSPRARLAGEHCAHTKTLRLRTLHTSKRCILTMPSLSPYKSFVPAGPLIRTPPSAIWKVSIKDENVYALVRYIKHPFTTLQAPHVNISMRFTNAFTSHKTTELMANLPPPHIPNMYTQSAYYISEPSAGYRAASSEDEITPLEDASQTFFSHPSSVSSLAEDALSLTQATPDHSRYYSHALSAQDREALTHGELNHNLKAYTPKDVVLHHESRKELVPTGTGGMQKIAKMEAIADIEQAKKDSQQVLTQKARDTSLLPWFRLLDASGADNRLTYASQATRSMYDLRSSHLSALQLRASALPPLLEKARKFSFDASPPAPSRPLHARAASDYFSQPYHYQSPPSPLCPPSHAPSRARSPLVPEAVRHTVDPSATFGSFLVPHKDGKGEVLLGSRDAKKEKMPKKGSKTTEKSTKTSDEEGTPEKNSRHRRTFGRMASMTSLSSLRKRSSRADLSKAVDDDVPEVPPLPRAV
jgi:hypothetical protein